MSIQEHLNKIRNAIYGREVRESIAKGIETAYDDASENGNANMEVKIARGTHSTLRDRLNEVDNTQQQTTAQLAHKANQAEVRKKSVPIGLNDASPEMLSAIEGGEGTSFNLESIPRIGSVTEEKTTFMKPTRNLFDGVYYPYSVAGSGTTAYLYDTTPNRRTAIVPIIAGKTYTVKVHEPDMSNNFRLATHTTKDVEFNQDDIANLTTLIMYEDSLKGHTFVADVTGYAFITVSNNSSEPRLQVELGDKATDYIERYVLDEDKLPEASSNAIKSSNETKEIVESYRETSKNLFDGKYYPYIAAGSVGGSALLYSTNPDRRSAIVPVHEGKTYYVKVHEPNLSDSFRIATHTTKDVTFNSQGVAYLTTLHVFNDGLKETVFTSDVDGYVFISVSSNAQEPKLQIEEGASPTEYVPHYVIKKDLVSKAIEENKNVLEALDKSNEALNRLEGNELFPKISNTEMIPTDPGARFIEFFDNKMWGYTFLNGDISYSADEGDNWIVHTNKSDFFSGAVHRLLPTNDGEVLAMTSSGLYKSNGWETGTVTWSESKITRHTNATLFQFSFDGDGTKFIIAEYGASVSNWPESRYVWISTDMGETFNVVWDSLEEHGEETNAVTHLHGVAYDCWDDRFYFSEGHGSNGGLYVSLDNGETWQQPSGYRDGVLKSGGIPGHQTENDTNGPTVLVATPTGLVMGSDNGNNGMFGLVKKESINDEVVTRTFDADYYKPGYLSMFAIRGFYDEKSGTVYIAFRSEYNDVPPIILAGTPTEADLIYEYPNLPVIGAQDHFGAIAKTGDDKLVAYAQFGGSPYTLQADLVYPASEIQTIIRLELKKLGVI